MSDLACYRQLKLKFLPFNSPKNGKVKAFFELCVVRCKECGENCIVGDGRVAAGG
jgi:hypothetical protein